MNDERLIDANALAERINDCWFLTRHQQLISTSAKLAAADAMCKLMAEVAKQPTVDAVPVVRCRQCIYASTTKFSSKRVACAYWAQMVSTDGYCSNGVTEEKYNCNG